MEPVQYLKALRRRWRLLVFGALLGGVVGWATAPQGAPTAPRPTFIATHTLVGGGQATSGNDSSGPNFQQLAFISVAGVIPERAADALDADEDALRRSLRVTVDTNIGALQMTAIAPDPAQAVAIADEFATQLNAYLLEQTEATRSAALAGVLARIDQLEQEIAQLDAAIGGGNEGSELDRARRDALVNQARVAHERLSQLATDGEVRPRLVTLAPAEPIAVDRGTATAIARRPAYTVISGKGSDAAPSLPTQSTVPQRASDQRSSSTTRAALGGILGLLAAAAGTLVFARLDPRIRGRNDAEDAFGLPVVGEIPLLGRRRRRTRYAIAAAEPHSAVAEAFRALRTSLLFATPLPLARNDDDGGVVVRVDPAQPRHGARVILVTSAEPSEGKSATVANLAAVFGEAGESVLIVNGDFRRPQLHEYVGAPEPSTTVPDSDAATVLPALVTATALDGVDLVDFAAVGERAPRPTEVLDRLRRVVLEASPGYQVILIDTAPLLVTNDASELLPVADTVVLTAFEGRTRKASAARAVELLERLAAPVAGVVVVGSTGVYSGRRSYYYAYGARLRAASNGDHDEQRHHDDQTEKRPATGRRRR